MLRPSSEPRTLRTARPSRRNVILGVTSGLVLITGACGPKRSKQSPPIDPGTSARLGLTTDSLDPTQRDKDAGYLMWKPKPEPVGTHDPTSPDRRKIGGPDF